MIIELLTGTAALGSAAGGIYAVVVSRSTREATTKKTAGEAADLITEAAGRFTTQLQEHADRTAKRNRELVEAINTLTDLMDEILESVARDGVVLGKAGCADRVADRELIARMRAANRQAKIVT